MNLGNFGKELLCSWEGGHFFGNIHPVAFPKEVVRRFLEMFGKVGFCKVDIFLKISPALNLYTECLCLRPPVSDVQIQPC